MKYSRWLFYFRKYLFLYSLLFFTTFLFLNISQKTKRCEWGGVNTSFRIISQTKDLLITSKNTLLSDVIFLAEVAGNKKIDQSIFSSNSLGLLRGSGGFSHQIFIGKMMRFSSENSLKIEDISEAYYNSINDKKPITLLEGVMSGLECRLRLIDQSKYYKKQDFASDKSLLSKFIDAQAKINLSIQQQFSRHFSRNVALLASGTLIGAQGYVDQDLKNDLITTGLIHVIVASGYNLTLVTAYTQNVLNLFCSKKVSLVCSLLFVWWYVILTGITPSILRAGWMTSLTLVAVLFGRPHGQLRGVAMSVLVMLCIDPTLLTNISFQLSVSSTVGVIVIHDKQNGSLTAKNNQAPHWLKSVLLSFKENAVTTFGANLFTFPIILFWFGRISIIAIVANTALLWLIPIVMMSAFFFLVTIEFHVFFAFVFILITSWAAELFLRGVEVFSRFPFATLDGLHFKFWQVFLYYVLLFIIFRIIRAKKRGPDRLFLLAKSGVAKKE